MAKHRDPLPEDLKELIALCRSGKLFAVKDWISSGKRFTLPPGNYVTSPFNAAMDTGFHSLVEVFLRAGVSQEDRDDALSQVASSSRLDLIELLNSYGADIRNVCRESVLCNRNPLILRWFVSHGMDLEAGNLIAYAFRFKNRGFLGAYLSIRDKVPSAQKQAAMALRLHARDGNMKWVSLLMWAGADPRMVVPDMKNSPAEDFMGTALEDAVCYGHVEILKKIGIDPLQDDPTRLLSHFIVTPQPEIISLLLDAGADPNGGDTEDCPMSNLMRSFYWGLDRTFWRHEIDPVVKCIELLASSGGRWRPSDNYGFRCFRRALGNAQKTEALAGLKRIVNSGAIERDVFIELMRTPKMKSLLSESGLGTDELRILAGHLDSRHRSRRRK